MNATRTLGRRIRIPLAKRTARSAGGAAFLFALGALFVGLGVRRGDDPRLALAALCGALLVLFAPYLLYIAYRIRTWPDFELTLRRTSITLPRYPLWKQEFVTVPFDEIQDVLTGHENNVPFIVLVSPHGRHRLAVQLLPVEWPAQAVLDRLGLRMRLHRLGLSKSRAELARAEAQELGLEAPAPTDGDARDAAAGDE